MKKRAHKDSILVERTYLTGDSTAKIYLLQVHRESRWSRFLKKVDRQIQRAGPIITRLSIALIAAMLTGIILIPAVEAERGYVAYGGEYLCIGLIYWAVFKISKVVVK